MIVMSDLVKDPAYRKFLTTMPRMPELASDKARMPSPPWVVYVQRKVDGPWGKKEFWSYKKALKFFSKALKLKVHDATINNRRIGFEPPSKLVRIKGQYLVGKDGVKRQKTKLIVWQPQLELLIDQPDHHWCKYCRRPTVFKYYSKHRTLGEVTSDVPRCCICGASARIAISVTDPLLHRV